MYANEERSGYLLQCALIFPTNDPIPGPATVKGTIKTLGGEVLAWEVWQAPQQMPPPHDSRFKKPLNGHHAYYFSVLFTFHLAKAMGLAGEKIRIITRSNHVRNQVLGHWRATGRMAILRNMVKGLLEHFPDYTF